MHLPIAALGLSRHARRAGRLLAVALLATGAAPLAAAPPADQVRLTAGAEVTGYVGTDVMIPMRDGTRLHAEVWRPKDQAGPLPLLMQRSPYGYGLAAVRSSFTTQFKELAEDGFIFVLEDIRGRFGSEGQFVMLRPTAAAGGVDESTDAYDSIDWLVKTLPGNNGKVGVFGVSYLGWTSAMATVNPHPALKAVSVQASPEDMFLGDDFHHNGAFRLDYAWEYAAALETDGRTMTPYDFAGRDPYDWYLGAGDLAGLDRRVVGHPLPTWRNFVAHPDYDRFWQAQVTSSHLSTAPTVPDLLVAGWWDQEDFYGPMTIFARQAPGDGAGRNVLVVGPWNHGGWAKPGSDAYGPFAFGADTGGWFRREVEVPWFRHWLKDDPAPAAARAVVFETGSNSWHRYAAWPPRDGVTRRRLFLHADGLLSWTPPTAAETAADGFVSDPAHPVPYRPRPVSPVIAAGSTWPVWQADDQTAFARRPDVLQWQTPVLDRDVVLRGNMVARLFASTTGSDADWVVKLIDVYPDDPAIPVAERGRELLIAGDVFRGRYRQSFEHPTPLTPGRPLAYAIDLHSGSHVFARGHRIAVQVQSSWFPLIDRNPQTFTPSIFHAAAADYHAQTHRVFHSPALSSAIELDVAEPGPDPTRISERSARR